MSTCDRNEDCRNGGICKFNTTTGVSECDCAERYIGPKCTRYCPLQCENDGICRFRAGHGEDEHLYGLDTNIEHYECKCMPGFTGRRCQAPFVECPDGRQCLNGGECTETSQNSTVYTCVCPYGFEGKQCASPNEERTYQKGPVTKDEPISHGGMVSIVLASLVVVVAIVLSIRKKRRMGRSLPHSEFDDGLMMLGRYSDAPSVNNDDDDKYDDEEDETGIEAARVERI